MGAPENFRASIHLPACGWCFTSASDSPSGFMVCWRPHPLLHCSMELNLILHCEEVVPGNPLKPTTERKLVALYWSWLQYGRLYREHVHPKLFRVDRSVHMKKIRGGYSFRIPKRRARRRPSLKRKPCNRRVHRLSGGPARKNSSAE